MDGGDKQLIGRKWSRLYAEALEYDSWGQLEEAQQTYTKCPRAARLHERLLAFDSPVDRLSNLMRNEPAQHFSVEEKASLLPNRTSLPKPAHCSVPGDLCDDRAGLGRAS